MARRDGRWVQGVATLLGSVLLRSASLKAWTPLPAMQAIRFVVPAADDRPLAAVALVGVATVWEAAIGLGLILWGARRWIVLSTGATLVAFTGVLGVLLVSADPPSCGCFGSLRLFESTRREAIAGAARNGAMLWLCAHLWLDRVRPERAVAA